MSVVFVPPRLRGKYEINPSTIQRLLDENNQLIQCIVEYQNKGKAAECTQYQQILHRNLIYLATIADSSQNAPSTQPVGLGQAMPTGSGGSVDPMGSGTPPPGPHTNLMPGTSDLLPHNQLMVGNAGCHVNVGGFSQAVAISQNLQPAEQGGNPGQPLGSLTQPAGQPGPVPSQQRGPQGDFFNGQYNQVPAVAEGMNRPLYNEGVSWYGAPQGQSQQMPSYQQYSVQQQFAGTPQEFSLAQSAQGQYLNMQQPQEAGQQYVVFRPQNTGQQPQMFQYSQGGQYGSHQ
uniref:Protein SSXT n=1 Tax=Callorhinchus milii TaxID=7868 RepID=V9KW02_CALMI